ncbi:MAG TPA: TonB-dependent receptor plug domain-containing protein [Steroidobacteraceae bacterium]|jgi:outer membrane receptor protein involved in Fe transport|nr:TonB-dependent receptor plug domain-containing protein [Steroidobacteraceae bacterium]
MHIFSRATCAIPFLFVTFTAVAQDSLGKDSSLDEVVVTADLRERSLSDLPASATVLDAHTLDIAGVQHFEDVLGLVPNLNWSAGTSRPRFFQLRGIGELSQWQGAPNPSVGFLIDGIDFSGVGMPATLADVERIEVLRGPQGTAYGANALAGLIAVNTRAPRREHEINADLTIGEYGTRAASGVMGGPVGDGEAAWRLVAGNYRSDGFRRNAYLGRDDTNGYNENNARLKFHAHPTEDLRVDMTAMWADLDNGYDAFSIDNSRTTLSDKPGQDTQISRALALRLDYGGADAFEVVSRSSFGTSRSVYSFDGDWGNDDSWGANSPYDYFQRFDRQRTTMSSDLRLVSRDSVDSGAAFAWLTGVYALRTEEDLQEHDVARDLIYGDYDQRFSSEYRATNLAGYGQVEWRLGAANVLAVGARIEQRSADYQDSNAAEFSPDETMFGGSVSLRHAFDDRRTGYVTLSRGYKAGGFNIGDSVPDDRRSFDAEALHNLELGFRATNADASLAGDLAVFYMRRKDQQVPTGVQLVPNDPLTFVLYTDNAAGGENYGLEGTLQWRPVESWLVDLRAAILETRYIDYVIGDRDLNGREQAHAPQYQFDLGLEYHGANGMYARLDFDGLDDFYFDESNDQRAPSRILTNLKAGVSGKHWRAEVWVRNMFDRYYSQRGFFFGDEPPDFTPTRYVQAGDPRHAGVTVTYTFR